MNSSSKDDMTIYLLVGGILLVLIIAFSYYNYGCSCSSVQSIKRNDFKSLSETLFTAPVPVVPMPFVVQQTELVVPSIGGVVLQGGTNNYIRVSGTATTDATRNTVGTTNNQIQIYNAGNLTAAFDVDGLYVKALNVGSGNITTTGSIGIPGTPVGAVYCGSINAGSGNITTTGSIGIPGTPVGAVYCGLINAGSGNITTTGSISTNGLTSNNGFINVTDASSSIRLITSGGVNYIQSGNTNFTAASTLVLCGHNANTTNVSISGNLKVTNGTINESTLSSCTISNSTINGTTTNSGTISGGTISNSTINGTTTNNGTISGGTLNGCTINGDYSLGLSIGIYNNTNRTPGITYRNGTKRPMIVTVNASSVNTSSFSIYINNNSPATNGSRVCFFQNNNANWVYTTLIFMVPPLWYYQIDNAAGINGVTYHDVFYSVIENNF
jgi:hypothetical protein